MTQDIRSIIKSHVTTERTTALRAKTGEYVFEVDKRANKHAIKLAIEKAFSVKVMEVRTAIVPGKVKRMGRFEGKSPTWKKAIVRLKKDQVISQFENA
ncbi:50S ribosomal protein L23 [candidate division GN15 bacterium]|uniref:Large ribosomal subunit protein uL23 n=1 Tax=candidate division GN15 bacterium TaxID=2072418 RepID=A0A855X5W5_9BACT|nr:MAG: 50S ribosomal protein L23 [candidate division GN15 bacterium]